MQKKTVLIINFILCLFLFGGCSDSGNNLSSSIIDSENVPSSSATGNYSREVVCLVPEALGSLVSENDVASIDYSNTSEGYVMAKYFGLSSKVKFQLTGPDEVTYTYNLTESTYQAFPLSAGDGKYTFGVYENIVDNQYSVALSGSFDVAMTNTFGPYLYPNQYVNFTKDSAVVAKAAELEKNVSSDLDIVSNVYEYVSSYIDYDYDKAANVQSGYISDVDVILNSGTGICLDYAAVMCSMLRSLGIPTRLEVGYAGEAYHAWISTYITDVGWVSGIIEFDGKNWSLMDPTFAATSNEKDLKEFVGDGTNYTVKYMY